MPKRNEHSNDFVAAGGRSYPEALAAVNEFRVTVHHLIREIVEQNLKAVGNSMGVELSRNQIEDYAKPFELGPSIDWADVNIGVRIKNDEPRWRQYFCLGWERGRRYSSASILVQDVALAEKIYNAMVNTERNFHIGLDKREVYVTADIKSDEASEIKNSLRTVIQEWIALWKRVGALRRFYSKAASASK